MNKTKSKFSVKKRMVGVAAGVLALLLAAFGAVWMIWGPELRTLGSFRKILDRNDAHLDGAVYEMTVSGDYYFEDFLAQGGVSTDADLIAFITQNLTKGLVDLEFTPPDVACASFTAQLETDTRCLPATTIMPRPTPASSIRTPVRAAMPRYLRWTCSSWGWMWIRM